MTCNPKWQEITNALLPGQTPQNRPDLCARIFKLKLKGLMSTVIEEKMSGTVIAHVRVIEFQKKGLPYAHVIFFLEETAKHNLRNPENVYQIISAEIPAELEGTELRELVLKHMIHTPCGDWNTNSPSMGDNGCKKYFPKDFVSTTSQSEDENYMKCKRRLPTEGGECVDRLMNVLHSCLTRAEQETADEAGVV